MALHEQAAIFRADVANGALRTWLDLQLAPPCRDWLIFLRPIEIGLACEFLAASGDLHGRFFSRARASSRFHTAKTQGGHTVGLASDSISVRTRLLSEGYWWALNPH
jgi:hypothetical protein